MFALAKARGQSLRVRLEQVFEPDTVHSLPCPNDSHLLKIRSSKHKTKTVNSPSSMHGGGI